MDVFEDYSKALLQRVVNLTDVNVSLLSVMVTPVLYNDEIRICRVLVLGNLILPYKKL